jgi:hypothetical protein
MSSGENTELGATAVPQDVRDIISAAANRAAAIRVFILIFIT